MKKIGQLMENISNLIALGWRDLSKTVDHESDVCILAFEKVRKVFLYSEGKEVGTFNIDDKEVPQEPKVTESIPAQYYERHPQACLGPGNI